MKKIFVVGFIVLGIVSSLNAGKKECLRLSEYANTYMQSVLDKSVKEERIYPSTCKLFYEAVVAMLILEEVCVEYISDYIDPRSNLPVKSTMSVILNDDEILNACELNALLSDEKAFNKIHERVQAIYKGGSN